MDPEAGMIYKRLKKKGLSPDQEQIILKELNSEGTHAPIAPDYYLGGFRVNPKGLYQYTDLTHLQQMSAYLDNYHACLKSIDELLEKDQQREKDGFPRKIRVGKMVKPRKGGKEKVVVVPTTVEEKFIHDPSMDESEEGEGQGGSGSGEEGEVIGEQPVHDPENGSGAGPGEGEDGAHEIESVPDSKMNSMLHGFPNCSPQKHRLRSGLTAFPLTAEYLHTSFTSGINSLKGFTFNRSYFLYTLIKFSASSREKP